MRVLCDLRQKWIEYQCMLCTSNCHELFWWSLKKKDIRNNKMIQNNYENELTMTIYTKYCYFLFLFFLPRHRFDWCHRKARDAFSGSVQLLGQRWHSGCLNNGPSSHQPYSGTFFFRLNKKLIIPSNSCHNVFIKKALLVAYLVSLVVEHTRGRQDFLAILQRRMKHLPLAL